MEWFTNLISNFTEAFRWWFVLQPWEQALRVRAGKYVRKFEGGIHFKVPYLDYIFKQNCRMRVSDMGNQTITTRDYKTITIAGTLRYKVVDVAPLYMSLHTAEDTLMQIVKAIVSEYIAEREVEECYPDKVSDYVNNRLDFGQYGLGEVLYAVTDFANVRTYRLINDGITKYSEHRLQTDLADDL